jgi:predicted dehydrogenase
MFKVCLLGVSHADDKYIQSLNRNKNFQLTCIVDEDFSKNYIKNTSKDYQVQFFTSFNDALVNCNFQVVIISDDSQGNVSYSDVSQGNVSQGNVSQGNVSQGDIFNYVMQALQNGKHVLCENPIESCCKTELCFDYAQSNNLKLMMGFPKIFDSNYTSLLRKLQNKKVNNIRLVTKIPSINLNGNSTLTPVENIAYHDVQFLTKIVKGELPEHIQVCHSEEIHNLTILLKYKKCIAVIENNNNCPYGFDQRAEVSGSFGIYVMNNVINNLNHQNICKYNSNYVDNSEIYLEKQQLIYLKQLETFNDYLQFEKLQNVPTKEELLTVQMICDKIRDQIS